MSAMTRKEFVERVKVLYPEKPDMPGSTDHLHRALAVGNFSMVSLILDKDRRDVQFSSREMRAALEGRGHEELLGKLSRLEELEALCEGADALAEQRGRGGHTR